MKSLCERKVSWTGVAVDAIPRQWLCSGSGARLRLLLDAWY